MKFCQLCLLLLTVVIETYARKNRFSNDIKRARVLIRQHGKKDVGTMVQNVRDETNEGKQMKKIRHKIGRIEDQIKMLNKRLKILTPKCKSNADCGEGTCCWKPKGKNGKCKMFPHRINQRCTRECGCKNGMYCHFRGNKKSRKKTRKQGKCYLQKNAFGIRDINYIPRMLEKIGGMEKQLRLKDKHL